MKRTILLLLVVLMAPAIAPADDAELCTYESTLADDVNIACPDLPIITATPVAEIRPARSAAHKLMLAKTRLTNTWWTFVGTRLPQLMYLRPSYRTAMRTMTT